MINELQNKFKNIIYEPDPNQKLAVVLYVDDDF